MGYKLQRTYLLTITLPNNTIITIEPPFTLELDVQRNTLASANTASFRIYNLGPLARQSIIKDDWATQQVLYQRVELKAGYVGSVLPTIFRGNIRHAWSVREGVNWITTIEAFDGGLALINSQIQAATAAGQPKSAAIRQTLQALSKTPDGTDTHVTIGAIGNQFNGTSPRGNTLNGNAAEVANTLTGNGFFVDLEKAYALSDNEFLDVPLITIDSDSGLLGTPIREVSKVTLQMLFEPTVQMCGPVMLNSTTLASINAGFNGLYKIVGAKHSGVISDAVAGSVITELQIWKGLGILNPVAVAP